MSSSPAPSHNTNSSLLVVMKLIKLIEAARYATFFVEFQSFLNLSYLFNKVPILPVYEFRLKYVKKLHNLGNLGTPVLVHLGPVPVRVAFCWPVPVQVGLWWAVPVQPCTCTVTP